jgi:hypothetical protein
MRIASRGWGACTFSTETCQAAPAHLTVVAVVMPGPRLPAGTRAGGAGDPSLHI